MPVPAPVRSRRLPPARRIAVALALPAALLLGACSGGSNGPATDRNGSAGDSGDDPAPIVDAVTAVIDASNAEDADAFRALVCRAEVDTFADLTDADPVDDPVRLTDVDVISQGTDSASAEVALTTGEGAGEITHVMRMDLVREDGDWKFCNMALVG